MKGRGGEALWPWAEVGWPLQLEPHGSKGTGSWQTWEEGDCISHPEQDGLRRREHWGQPLTAPPKDRPSPTVTLGSCRKPITGFTEEHSMIHVVFSLPSTVCKGIQPLPALLAWKPRGKPWTRVLPASSFPQQSPAKTTVPAGGSGIISQCFPPHRASPGISESGGKCAVCCSKAGIQIFLTL